MVFSGYQSYKMRQSVEAAREQANAATIQANAAQSQVNATERSLNIAVNTASNASAQNEKTINAMQTQANASEKQADTSQVSASAAEQSAKIASQSMIATTRPYMGIGLQLTSLNPDEPMKADVTYYNEGNSSAEIGLEYEIRLDTAIANMRYETKAVLKPIVVLPRMSRIVKIQSATLSKARVEAVKDGKLYLFFYGRGSYKGLGGPYPIDVCLVYRKEVNVFGECADVR